ncbi:Integrator complex subunit 3 [Euphorbia peplus]|nr:Integrator complex subunit 3 [Euphorbia peplus]
MASKLFEIGTHEAKIQLEVCLRQAFEELEPKLRPPFSLAIPSPKEYLQLNRAILYGILTEPQLAKIHIKHLHAIVTDGYAFFVSLIANLINDFYAKLVESAKHQLIWVVKEVLGVLGVGFDGLLVSLLRQIIGGDFSDRNLYLCFELVSLFLCEWDCILEEAPLVLTSALYVYLRLLADHCRILSNAKLESLKLLEIEFCIKMLREQFLLCMKIGRDLIRLLQDLVHVPTLRPIWKDLVLNPGEFKTPGFSDISQLYSCRTSSRYFLLRITPEVETQLRFLLTHVKFGSQKRHQSWFCKKFLFAPERETLIVDIVRFICCAHHPSNEIIQSDIIPRWAVIGWLLKVCRKNHVQANAKLALFYDWLFFDEGTDNVMNIEPGMLLMIYSIPKYIDMTHSLLEFLILVGENYDLDHSHLSVRGLSSAFNVLVQKGVVQSLDVLTSCNALSPFLKEKLGRLLSSSKAGILSKSLPVLPLSPVPHFNSENLSTPETQAPSVKQPTVAKVDVRLTPEPLSTSVTGLIRSCEGQHDTVESLMQNLSNASVKSSLQILEAVLLSFVNLDNQPSVNVSVSPEVLCPRIEDQFKSLGSQLFAPRVCSSSASCFQIMSATSLIARTFIFSQHEVLQEMLLFWSRNGFSVGTYLLYYASQLVHEAYGAGYLGDGMIDNSTAKLCESGMPFLFFHVNGYVSFLNGTTEDSHEEVVPTGDLDKKLIVKLVEDAFAAYKCFLKCSKTILHEDAKSLSNLFLSDIILCLQWETGKAKFFFRSMFRYLSDVCMGDEDIIRFLIKQLDHAEFVNLQFDIGLKKFSVFGESTEIILFLIKKSMSWDSLEQHKFWALMRSEVAVSKVEVENIILQFLYCDDLDPNISAIAVGGLLTLCSSCAPSAELVRAIMLLPNNVFQDFAATTLATWAVSNPAMLIDSLAKFSEQINNNCNAIDAAGVTINRSAVLWLLSYFSAKGMKASDIFSNFPSSNPGG